MTHAGPARLRERLAWWSPSEYVDLGDSKQTGHLLHDVGSAEIPIQGEAAEMVPVCLQCLRIMVGAKHHSHAGLLQPQAHPSRTREEVRG